MAEHEGRRPGRIGHSGNTRAPVATSERRGRVDPNELPNAVMSTESMIESGFTLNPSPAPDPHDKCFIYTKEKLWLEVPKGTDPVGKR